MHYASILSCDFEINVFATFVFNIVLQVKIHNLIWVLFIVVNIIKLVS